MLSRSQWTCELVDGVSFIIPIASLLGKETVHRRFRTLHNLLFDGCMNPIYPLIISSIITLQFKAVWIFCCVKYDARHNPSRHAIASTDVGSDAPRYISVEAPRYRPWESLQIAAEATTSPFLEKAASQFTLAKPVWGANHLLCTETLTTCEGIFLHF